MATYKQVGYGSQGSDVTELQKLLNKNGYTLDEDGIFGDKTQAAVKDYQKKNNLDVDGIVGNNTWGALTKVSTPSETTPSQNTGFQYSAYQESDTVKQAEQMLQQQMGQKPGAYQSQWQDQLNEMFQKIMNREDFSYDLNGDALYQQYKDQYVNQGQIASMDAMGQAAGLTGGYGNSYGQNVGQQAYQGYLQQLNDRVPELYQLALDQYNQEGQELYDQYGMMAGQEAQDYDRYQDQMGDWRTELERLYGQYNAERDYDYGKWADNQSFGYQQHRDQIADQQWQAQFDEAKRQYDEQMALAKGDSSSGNEGKDGANYTANPGWDKAKILAFQRAKGLTDDGIWGPETAAAYDKDPNWKYQTTGKPTYPENGSLTLSKVKLLQRKLGVTEDGIYGPETQKAAGGLSADEAYNKYVLGKGGSGNGFTGSTYSEAAAYLKSNGISASGLMTQSEWQRHKNSSNSAGGEHEASSYQEYLAAYIYGKTKK